MADIRPDVLGDQEGRQMGEATPIWVSGWEGGPEVTWIFKSPFNNKTVASLYDPQDPLQGTSERW